MSTRASMALLYRWRSIAVVVICYSSCGSCRLQPMAMCRTIPSVRLRSSRRMKCVCGARMTFVRWLRI